MSTTTMVILSAVRRGVSTYVNAIASCGIHTSSEMNHKVDWNCRHAGGWGVTGRGSCSGYGSGSAGAHGAKRGLASASSSGRENAYETLGVKRTASLQEIRNAYRKLALKHHPDRNTNATEKEKLRAAETFKRVSAAYSAVGDEASRRQYDSGMAGAGTGAWGGTGQPQGERRGQHQAYYYSNRYGGGYPPHWDARQQHQAAEEIFRAVFGPGTIEEIIKRAYRKSASSGRGSAFPFGGPFGGQGGFAGQNMHHYETRRSFMRRRPDGTNVMVTEVTVQNPDGSVTTSTTETEMGNMFNQQSSTTTTTTTTTRKRGAQSSAHAGGAGAAAGHGGGLMTSFFTRLMGQAVAGFLISFIPKLIGWVLRFLLVGARRR